MKEHFKSLACIFGKMRALCKKASAAGATKKNLEDKVEAMRMLKATMRKVEGCMREMRAVLLAEINNARKKTKRKALGSPQSPKPKKRKRLTPKQTVFYGHSDFESLEEYVNAMRRPPISDKEVAEVDWDEEFRG
jgi:hypothetical protein